MITGVFGLPGSGKSTILAKIAKKYQRKGITVYCLADYPVDGCRLIRWQDIGHFIIDNGVLLIDEVSLNADNRDFKSFTAALKQFFILHRHYNVDVYWFTQQYDGVDRKIRELTHRLYYVRSHRFLPLSYMTALDRVMFVPSRRQLRHNPNLEISTKWVKCSIFALLFFPLSGACSFCFRLLYYKMFDSFQTPKLPKKDFPLYQISKKKKS